MKQPFQDETYYNAYEKDIAIVNILFGEPTAYGEFIDIISYCYHVSEYERLPKMTWLDFISGFCSIYGLCLGISFFPLLGFSID